MVCGGWTTDATFRHPENSRGELSAFEITKWDTPEGYLTSGVSLEYGNLSVEAYMSDRRWILNRKCFAALRAMGNAADRRWKYIHVGPKGVTCTDTVSLIRVSLPKGNGINQVGASVPVIFDYETMKKLAASGFGNGQIEMPEGLLAKTTGQYTVPNYDVTIPKPEDQTATITVDARSE